MLGKTSTGLDDLQSGSLQQKIRQILLKTSLKKVEPVLWVGWA